MNSTFDRTVNPDPRLLETQRAFDSVARNYDGPIGNNALVQKMRAALWRAIEKDFPAGARLLDLGCGTGIDAVYFAQCGYQVVATDWSPRMIERTRARVADAGVSGLVRAQVMGLHQLETLHGEEFDGIYSDLGPLNCAADLLAVARSCSDLLKPRGRLLVSVIGRRCPWEFAYYLARGDWARARLRGARGAVPVNLNGEKVWTRYYTPHEFYRAFADEFDLTSYRALNLFLPPPYLIRLYARWHAPFALLGWLDNRLGALPLLRDAGDHFLMGLTKRD